MDNEEYEEITLKEAMKSLSRLEHQLEYWESEREIIFEETQPGATDYERERTSGGITPNKNDTYIIKLEKIDKKINILKKRINNLKNYIDKEMNELDPTEAKIIILRDKRHLKWEDIATMTNYSLRQVQRKYYKHIK